MKAKLAKNPPIRIVVAEDDPLRFVGFRELLEAERDFELTSAPAREVDITTQNIDVVLLGNHSGQDLFDVTTHLKATRPDVRIIVTGPGNSDEAILRAIASGAKGYVDEAAPAAEFVQAIRMVNEGLVWAPRRVLSKFIDQASSPSRRAFPFGRIDFTTREKEVLEMLVAGRSNKEIAKPLGIEERTVKAHVAKLMRKVGVRNRITLSIHAVKHSLVSAP